MTFEESLIVQKTLVWLTNAEKAIVLKRMIDKLQNTK